MKKEKELPMYSSIREHIYGKSRGYHISIDELAACTGRIVRGTLHTRLREPGEFRLCELVAIANKLNMSMAELLGL